MAKLTPYVQDYQVVRPLRESASRPHGTSASPKGLVFHILPDNRLPVQVLDIGFGAGSLGHLIRQSPETSHWSVDGVDGWEANCNNADLVARGDYRNVWHGLAQDIPSDRLAQYDILCLLDVIEHLDAGTAKWLLRTLLSSMGDHAHLFISTPLWFYPQDHVQDGDLEEHLIGVPATSMFALLPTMYSVNAPLIGGFVLSKRSLSNIEFFQPTADRHFTMERGAEILNALRMPHQQGVVYKT